MNQSKQINMSRPIAIVPEDELMDKFRLMIKSLIREELSDIKKNDDPGLTRNEAAEELGCSGRNINNMMSDGRLKVNYWIGNSPRFLKSQIDKYKGITK